MAYSAVDMPTYSPHIKALASSSPSLHFAPFSHVETQRTRRRSTIYGSGGDRTEKRAALKGGLNHSIELGECEGDGVLSWVRAAMLLGEPGDWISSPFQQRDLPVSLCSPTGERDLVGRSQEFFASVAPIQSAPPSRQKQDDEDKQDCYVNIGYAIRTLRDELPAMFYKELTYHIYREDIVYCDTMNVVSGIDNYKLVFKALRFYGKIFFRALWVDILRVWQPTDNVILVRWQVRGIPRVPWEAHGIFDGTSEYKLDRKGKIYEHKVDNVALNSRPKFKIQTVAEMLQVGTCPSTPKPTFFRNLSGLWLLLPYMMLLTWMQYYLALKATLEFYQQPHFLSRAEAE